MRRELDGQMWESLRTVFISRLVKLSYLFTYCLLTYNIFLYKVLSTAKCLDAFLCDIEIAVLILFR